jgi:putative restriction endonuclease
MLEAVAADPYAVNDADIDLASSQRKQVIRTVQQKVRSSRFRASVLEAYQYKCAFCGIQLNLVQAAHILPVATPESVDKTYNGVAACYQHHAAYDQALITFDGQYQIHFNDVRLELLAAIQRDAGSDDFQAQLRQDVILPKKLSNRPHIEYVSRANQLRGWNL